MDFKWNSPLNGVLTVSSFFVPAMSSNLLVRRWTAETYLICILLELCLMGYRLSPWLAIISWWGPYGASDVPDVIKLHTYPRFRFWLMTKSGGTYVDIWCQGRHWPSTALINWLLPIAMKKSIGEGLLIDTGRKFVTGHNKTGQFSVTDENDIL